MTSQSDAVGDPPFDPPLATPATLMPTRPFYWSLRRELWEHRSIYVGPMAAAGVVLFGFLLGMMALSHQASAGWLSDVSRHGDAIAVPYDFAAIAIIVTSMIVAVTYCLGALYNERRDRSILFWKSLPVSDLATVGSKAAIPMVVTPLVALAVVVATQLIMLLLNSAVLLLHGASIAPLWSQAPPFQSPLVLPYGLAVLGIWNAPIYGWLLMVSAWARRAPFLWAVLPPLALCLVEKIAFDTTNLGRLLGRRLSGGFGEAFSGRQVLGGAPEPDPIRFLSNPDVWTGLAVAGAFLAAAIWLRRYREPI